MNYRNTLFICMLSALATEMSACFCLWKSNKVHPAVQIVKEKEELAKLIAPETREKIEAHVKEMPVNRIMLHVRTPTVEYPDLELSLEDYEYLHACIKERRLNEPNLNEKVNKIQARTSHQKRQQKKGEYISEQALQVAVGFRAPQNTPEHSHNTVQLPPLFTTESNTMAPSASSPLTITESSS